MVLVGVVSGTHTGMRGYGMPITSEKGGPSDRWRVQPVSDCYSAHSPAICCRTSLRMVPDIWLSEVSHKRYRPIQIMNEFQGPDLTREIVPESRFSQMTPPGTNEITSWWGSQVFNHMAARLVQKLATTWKKQENLYWFRGNLVRCGVVYGDGNNQTQLQPRNAFIQNHQQWWPVLFVPCDGMQLAVYCQDQALSNSKPWRTHPDRVVLLRTATQQLLSDQTSIPRPPATAPPAAPAAAPPAEAFDYENHSTVVIQEVDHELEDKTEGQEVEDDTQHREWMIVEEF